MLMTPRRRIWDRPWAVPTLMAAVLALGLALGIGLGLSALKPAKVPLAQLTAPETLDRAPRREEPLAEPDAREVTVTPMLPPPPPRPGGPNDEAAAEPAPEPPEDGKSAAAAPEVAAVPLILPQPSVKATAPDAPAWLRHAVPAPKVTGHPMIAIVIDDMGVDKKRSERMAALRAPLTLSYLTYAEDLDRQTVAARRRGHELMLHMPMQPQAESYDPGQNVLEVNLGQEEIRRRVVWGLDRFDGYVGINNHMGSKFTADRTGMRVVMEELRKRGLLFIDSVTSEKTVGSEMAKRYGVPTSARNVFLDNDETVAAVRLQLARTEAQARKSGYAIAIGHPRDATIDALAAWLPGLEARGFVLVPVTTIVRQTGGAGG